MRELLNQWSGETAYVVGRGPSLLRVTPLDFEASGPVIVLNRALVQVRRLGLTDRHPVISLQKDGCVPHSWQDVDFVKPAGHVCPPPMLTPQEPEALIVSAAEAPNCIVWYPRRWVVDVEADLGCPWYEMSAAVAVRLGILFGVTSIVMLGHDSYTHDDTHAVEDGGDLVDYPHNGYRLAAVHAETAAQQANVPLRWVP